jgi:Zn-dependent alcohol dehydrogenase
MRSRKRIKGKAFGMTGFINLDEYDKSISKLIKELTAGGMGEDYCFDPSNKNGTSIQIFKLIKLTNH